MSNTRNLSYFPVSLFSATMGFAGLTLAFMASTEILNISPRIFQTLGVITLVIFAVTTLAYLSKIIRYPSALKAEFNHPIAHAFFPTFSISLLLISMIFSEPFPEIAAWFWYAGAALQLLLTLLIVNQWMHGSWQINQLMPSWFIPAVGNIIVPIGAISYATVEIGWFFFSIGLFFWLSLKTVILYRLFFHDALPAMLKPTLFIFIAPPAMGFLSYIALNEFVVDGMAYFLFSIALLMTLLLLTQIKQFVSLPFSPTWWAYTFPLAAMTNASFLMYELSSSVWVGYLAALLIASVTTLIVHVSIKTLMLIKNKQLCAAPQPAQPQQPTPNEQSN